MSVVRITGSVRLVQLGICAVALLLRLIAFPHRDEIRNIDEPGYLTGSLAILEGLPAGYKAAPAGPNFWVGWLYAGATSAWHTVHPSAEERAVPAQVRPFVAVNHTLFDLYRDMSPLRTVWILTQLALALWATFAAFRLGWVRGGLAGGILMGGFLAVLPLYVDFTLMSRPYMTAWAFGVLSLDAAVSRPSGKRIVPAAILMGLAIASRVEMLLFLPVVFWEFWNRPEPVRLTGLALRFVGVTLVAALIAAPWLMTHLIGNLRTIATVRLGPNPNGPTTLFGLLKELAWAQGLAGAMLGLVMVAIAIAATKFEGRLRLLVLTVYVALLLASLGHGTVYLHQQSPIVLALIALSVFSARQIATRWIAVGFLLIPLGQTIAKISDYRRLYVPNPSAQWVEDHIPSGTIVYLQQAMQNPLPTSESANALWNEVNDENAGRRKFESGLERFGLTADQIPRALSDENLVQERGNRRGWFILGSRPGLPDARFDIRLYDSSPVFGVHDVAAAFKSTGGIVVSQGTWGLPELGTPVMQWVGPAGDGTFIYCSPDVKARLKP